MVERRGESRKVVKVKNTRKKKILLKYSVREMGKTVKPSDKTVTL